METFEWNENIPVTANNLNEMQSILGSNFQLKGTILWENLDTTSSFSAQTVTLSESLSNYDKYEIIFKQGSGSSDLRVLSTGIIPTLYGTILSYAVNNRYRLVDVPNGNQINFQSGMNNNSVDNTKCLPLYIIGYNSN